MSEMRPVVNKSSRHVHIVFVSQNLGTGNFSTSGSIVLKSVGFWQNVCNKVSGEHKLKIYIYFFLGQNLKKCILALPKALSWRQFCFFMRFWLNTWYKVCCERDLKVFSHCFYKTNPKNKHFSTSISIVSVSLGFCVEIRSVVNII